MTGPVTVTVGGVTREYPSPLAAAVALVEWLPRADRRPLFWATLVREANLRETRAILASGPARNGVPTTRG